MTAYEKGVLFEREGDILEVGIIPEDDSTVVEFIDGTRLPIQDGDYLDPIGPHCEDWDEQALRALHSGLVARTMRQVRSASSKGCD